MLSYAYTDELYAPIYLAFDEFKVAGWWIIQFHLHRNQPTVKLNNIRGLYTELVNAKAGSEHTLSIEPAAERAEHALQQAQTQGPNSCRGV